MTKIETEIYPAGTLFDLDNIPQKPSDEPASKRWALYFTHEGEDHYLFKVRRKNQPVENEWMPLKDAGKLTPHLYSQHHTAMAAAHDWNAIRKAQYDFVVYVKEWTLPVGC